MSKRTLMYIAIAVGLIYAYYSAKRYIGKRQAHIVSAVIQGEFKEDLAFVSSFLPVICNEDNSMSIFIAALVNTTNSGKDIDSAALNRDLVQLVRRIPNRMAIIRPKNDWQQSFIEASMPCTQELRNISSKSDINSRQNQQIINAVTACMQSKIASNNQLKIQLASHFSNRALKNITNNYNTFTDKFAVAMLGQGIILIEGKDAMNIYASLRDEFMKNRAFKQAYHNGCLKQLDEIAESVIMLYFLQNRGFEN